MEIAINSLEKASRNPTIMRFMDAWDDCQLIFYAQDWMKTIGYNNMDELNVAISPLIDAMKGAEINASENIKAIYRCSQGNVFKDWKLSRLGLTYLAFNAPHKSPKLRQLQLKMLANFLNTNDNNNR